MRTLLIALGAAVLDQLVKWIVQTHMELGQTIPLIKSVFHLTYILNPGAAFGLLPHKDWFFLAIVVVLYAAFFIMRKKFRRNRPTFRLPLPCFLAVLWETPLTVSGLVKSLTSLISASGPYSMWRIFLSAWG